eukprot:Sdes_comp21367_c0_seq1m20011
MTDAFLGSQVLVCLHTGIRYQGTVSKVEPNSQTLTIACPVLVSPDEVVVGSTGVSELEISSCDIEDLKILRLKESDFSEEPQLEENKSQPNYLKTYSQITDQPKISDGKAKNFENGEGKLRSKATSLNRKSKPTNLSTTQPQFQSQSLQTPVDFGLYECRSVEPHNYTIQSPLLKDFSQSNQAMMRNSGKGKKERFKSMKDSAAFSGEVSEMICEDFDFEGNLKRFDKKKIFQKLLESQTIPAHERLHHININKSNHKSFSSQNYAPHENVLDGETHGMRRPEMYSNSCGSENASRKEETFPGGFSENAVKLARNHNKGPLTETKQAQEEPVDFVRESTTKSARFKTEDDILVDEISTSQFDRVFLLAERTGMLKDVILENSGRSVADLMIHLVGGARRFHVKNIHQSAFIFILCTDNLQGYISLVAARHLASHNARVLVATPLQESFMSCRFRTLLNLYLSTDGAILYDGSLQGVFGNSHQGDPIDLVLDGLMLNDVSPSSRQYYQNHLQKSLLSNAEKYSAWLASCSFPILSLDFSSRGSSPQWVALLGFPQPYHAVGSSSKKFILVDIGIPFKIYSKIFPSMRFLPFGGKSFCSVHPF